MYAIPPTPVARNRIGGPNMLGTFTVRIFNGVRTQPIKQFNVLLRTCDTWLSKDHFKYALRTYKDTQHYRCAPI